ncbi:hypothetical protein Tcan_13132 [Toxocara canis]|uniref:Potassium channel domain-containing protein n=1 Tax=Toxocara canis TaxID=6265 RepID=A0A0B2UNQ7_TOXCA|nr:hypothetical protein Tcan_13132 [Toxocara canis]
MLIRRCSSLFDSQYSRIRLPRSPSELRLAEEQVDQISLFNSRTPSPSCENFANRFDQPSSSREWDESANHLIERYEDEVFSPSARLWKLSNSFLFAVSLLTTIGNIPGTPRMPLSENGRLIVLLWSPVGICLYYYCIWILSLVLYKLPLEWQLCLLMSSVMLVAGRTFFLLLSRSFTADHAYTFTFTLLNIGNSKRSKNIINSMYCYLLTEVDKSLIDIAIDDLKNFALHQQQS